MQDKLRIITILLLISLLFPLACTAPSQPTLQDSFYVYRFNPPAFLGFSKDFEAVGEIPFALPPNCELFHVLAAPVGKFMAVELSCPSGQTVLFLNTSTLQHALSGSQDNALLNADSNIVAVTQPIPDTDSHFLAWRFDGSAAFLRVDSLGNPRVLRVSTDGAHDLIPNTEFTYDLASSLNKPEYTFTFSRGLGRGSELWIARNDGKVVEQLYADQDNYISFVRFSPDGGQIAFIKIPDTQTPFTVGELWVMNNDGSNAVKLADADAGHGYAANWSPDGERIAFVARENSEDERADQSSDALISNIYIVEVKTGAFTQVTDFEKGRVETPVWSPEENTLAFNVVIDDRMEVRIVDLRTGEIRSLIEESTCCPAWLRE